MTVNQFSVHKATVWKHLHQFVDAVKKILLPKCIYMPNDEEASQISNNFEKISHIPQTISCIDSTHIPSSNGYRDFINHRRWPSVVLQAMWIQSIGTY